MRRFWIEPEQLQGELVSLTGEVLHHVKDVCRFKAGDRFEVMPGNSKAYAVEVIEMKKKEGLAKILSERDIPPLPRPYIHLMLSLPRYNTMDNIIEKAVELGVKRLVPFVSDFSFVRNPGAVPPSKSKRWHKIIRAASQQSARGSLMEVTEPTRLEEVLENFNRQTKVAGLFPYEGHASLTIHQALKAVQERSAPVEDIWLFVGSEGGFSEREVELFAQYGLEATTFGDQILRVETACLALVSIIKYEFEAI